MLPLALIPLFGGVYETRKLILYISIEMKTTKTEYLDCDQCHVSYPVSYKAKMNKSYRKKALNELHFCGSICRNLYKGFITPKSVPCTICTKEVLRNGSALRKSKHIFCSKRCAAIYSNAHKTTGNRRSKLEIWLEQEITQLYSFELHFNRRDAINSELDIYLPSLKLAFELNGIFHYEPIFGIDKLSQIQNNDGRKFQACLEAGIELCIIDTSSQKYFKPSTSLKYLDIIKNIIDSKNS